MRHSGKHRERGVACSICWHKARRMLLVVASARLVPSLVLVGAKREAAMPEPRDPCAPRWMPLTPQPPRLAVVTPHPLLHPSAVLLSQKVAPAAVRDALSHKFVAEGGFSPDVGSAGSATFVQETTYRRPLGSSSGRQGVAEADLRIECERPAGGGGCGVSRSPMLQSMGRPKRVHHVCHGGMGSRTPKTMVGQIVLQC